MSAIILASKLVHYEALGRGKPLLFLHDWLGSWRYWIPTMLDISSIYRAYALDFWGFGDSDKVPHRYNISGYVDQIALFLDQMGIEQVPIVGHGLGGIVAVHYALANPGRVDQIMLVSVPLSADQISRPLANYNGGHNPARAILGRKLKSYEEVDLEAEKTDGEAVVSSLRSAVRHEISSTLSVLNLPVALVNSREDPVITAPDESTLLQFGDNIFAYIFENAQHFPMLDEASKFNRLLRDFLMYKDNWDAIKVKSEWKRRMR
ncbi:MAG: alpha/beta hydrolase [Anaerolineae bacterium]|nr:alpha/beta hydrolase [Anaerolineae bacterium]